MSKKRRVFDIDLPEDDSAKTFPAGKVSEKERRGPMAAAITENAESLKERERIEAAIRAENDQLAHEHVRLKSEGLIVERIPFDQIKMKKIMRDRSSAPDEALGELVESIRSVGLSNPILVEPTKDGKYELIQGFRRIAAFKRLLKATADKDAYSTIPARVVAGNDTIETLHRRMVDENLVRKDISFAEMAQLAINYAADDWTQIDDPEKAVKVLFKSTSYSKRSYIRKFIKLMQELGGDLEFSHEIPRALGLGVAALLEKDPDSANAIRRDLKEFAKESSAKIEMAILRHHAKLDDDDAADAKEQPAESGVPSRGSDPQSKAKVTFQIKRPEGAAKCTAGAGRLEIRLDRDFSTVDRRMLEGAVRAMLDRIG